MAYLHQHLRALQFWRDVKLDSLLHSFQHHSSDKQNNQHQVRESSREIHNLHKVNIAYKWQRC